MDKMQQPPGGDPQDFWPTQEIGPAGGQPGQPSGPPGPGGSQPGQGPGWGHPAPPTSGRGRPGAGGSYPGPGWGQPGSGWGQPGHPAGGRTPPPPSPPRRRGKAAWWGAGLALVAVLAGGGAFAATQLSGSTSPATAGPTGQAAQLNALLNSASSPASAAAATNFGTASASSPGTDHPCLARAARLRANGHPYAAQTVLRLCRHRLRGIRLLGGIHGEFTFKTQTGYHTLAYERGTIDTVSGSDVVVQAADGTTWTWVLQSNTVIRQDRNKVTASALSDGEQVFAGGPVVSGVYDARLIVIRPASAGTAPSPSPSPAAGS